MKCVLSLFFTLICFSSCTTENSNLEMEIDEEGKENEEVIPETPAEETKSYLSKLSSDVTATTEENSFDFTDFNNSFLKNQNGTIESWEIGFIGQTTKWGFQNESGNITKLTITEVNEENQSSSTEEISIAYNENDKIVKIESFSDEVKNQEYDIVYNDPEIDFIDQIDNRHRKITMGSNNNIIAFYQESIDFKIDFEYSNGNLSKKTLNQTNILSYAYDDKNNPFKSECYLNLSLLINYLNVIGGWEFLFYDENYVFNNANNIIGFTVENNDFGGLENQRFSYEYNSEDYPIKRVNIDSSITLDYIYAQE
ncbi:hypothetical protein LV716_07780 [Flagellimonas sp. HMM57]|uniref:hypothetical protein n=1 Tax=unclassified Flagellimonas TaxID=2644544 RepID=UPI0013D6230E|nr:MULTISPECIES: hypothetical protein [unclassified Flagellimonas]UII77657.1 hypothetical protein LV716_07780 [Flagellimonas sp. HMM57]